MNNNFQEQGSSWSCAIDDSAKLIYPAKSPPEKATK